MYRFLLRQRCLLTSIALLAVVAGCTVPVKPEPEPPVQGPRACTPVAESEQALGNWLAVRSQKGVSGELRTLFTLQADGTMAYTEQLKRSGQPSQGLSETGCWYREGQTLVLQTQESNSSPVNLDDPIYTNRYTVLSVDDKTLRLITPDGIRINAKRMSSGYRLPF